MSYLIQLRRMWITAACLILTGCSALSLADSGNQYPIKDAGVPVFGDSFQTVYWLDNERVLFLGYTAPIREPREENKVLYVWNVGTNEVKQYGPPRRYGMLCYADGYVRYNFGPSKGSESGIMEGPFGREQLVRKDAAWFQAYRDGKVRINPLTCKEYKEGTFNLPDGRWRVPLRDGHLWGNVKPDDHKPQDANVLFYPDQIDRGIRLPVKEKIHAVLRYSEYLQAYIIKQDRSRFYGEQKVWYLYSDGHMTEIVVPDGPWMRGSTSYLATKRGLLMISHASRLNADGAYIVNGDPVDKVVSGFIHSPAVSPDGCWVAFAIQTPNGPSAVSMKAINLCSKGE